jgi:hypothetical protein
MDVPKQTDEASARFRDLASEGSGVEVKPMFGTLAALVDGHVFAVALGDVVGVKLPRTPSPSSVPCPDRRS